MARTARPSVDRPAPPARGGAIPSAAPPEGRVVDLVVDGIAGGGDGVGRGPDGRAVFVAGALPGEQVRVRLTDVRPRYARGDLLDVVTAGAGRRPAPCPHLARGCGGCDWQHAEPATQSALRLSVVRDALARLGGVADPVVGPGPALPDEAVRTTVRAVVAGGRAGFRRRRSHEAVLVDSCLVAHPAAAALLAEGRFGAAEEVVIRVGARTGERLVLATPTAEGVTVPDGVVVVGADELAAGRRAWFHEEAAGRRWRVSARSFFQASPEAADALVGVVRGAVAETAPEAREVADLCAGVGLFAGSAAPAGARVVAVESSPDAVADARHNLAGPGLRVVRTSLERWRPSPADVVIADPPRAGLGRTGVARVAATGAGAVVLVSCDPAALGRDAGLLAGAGYRLVGSVVLDLFPQTSHVEVVSRFTR